MKGIIVLQPFEYTLEAVGEKWRQGDKLKGFLTVKNNSADQVEVPAMKISIRAGNFKKVKSKEKKAWEIIEEIILGEKIILKASEVKNYSFEFLLPENCVITDKNGSVYLAYEDLSALGKELPWPVGHIELLIEPKIVMHQVLEIFENFLRFKIGQTKYADGMVEVKMTPPTSRELSHVDSFVLSMSEIEKSLKLQYLFNLRVLEMVGTTMVSEKKTKQFEQILTSKQYLIYGNSPNQEFILESIQSILKDVKPKLF